MVLERHFQRHRDTAESVRDLVGRHRQVALARGGRGIASRGLEVGRRRAQQRQVTGITGKLVFAHVGDAFEPGHEDVGDRFVAVHVDREIDTGRIHRAPDRQHFGRPLCARFMPFAVEVHADGIGAKVPAARSVGIGIGHDMQRRCRSQPRRDRIGGIGQGLERAFHPPFGHRFAGMLPGVEPDLLRPGAGGQAVDRLSLDRMAQHAVRHMRCRRDPGDEIVMPLHRIGREVGEPRDIAVGAMPDRQRAAADRPVPLAVRAQPVLPVVRYRRAIAGPAAGIGAAVETGDLQGEVAPRRAGNAEVEPLEELAVAVPPDGQHGLRPGDGDNLYVAAVEGGVDANRVSHVPRRLTSLRRFRQTLRGTSRTARRPASARRAACWRAANSPSPRIRRDLPTRAGC